MRLRRALAMAAVAAVALTGCARTVDGSGHPGAAQGSNSGSGHPDFSTQPGQPTPSGSPTETNGPTGTGTPTPTPSAGPDQLSCPNVAYPAARLSFTCVTDGMTQSDNEVWPLTFTRTVEPATKWVLEEGAGHWGSAEGQSLAAIANTVRERMVDGGGYGDSPKVATVKDADGKVGGATAHLLQSMVTINPTWASQQHTKVTSEQLWIVAIQVGSDDVSLWYTSIPNLAQNLWPKVPAVIDSIHVG